MPRSSWISVITYSDGAQPVGTTKGLQQATPKLKTKLAKRIRALSAEGRTNIHDGLHRAFHPRRKPAKDDITKGPDTIFLLTDGDPSAGAVTSRVELRDAVIAWNLGRMIRIHTINVGDARSPWLEQLARETDGRFLDLTSDPDPGPDK
jgi:Mg-chelatase subunit ChlD